MKAFILVWVHPMEYRLYNIEMAEQQQNAQLDDPQLKGCWAVVQAGSDDDYMPEDIILEWVNRALAEKQLSDKFAHTDIKKQLHVFIKQVHELDRSTISNVMFKFQQAVQFYRWLVDSHDKDVQQQHHPQNKEQEHEQEGNTNKDKHGHEQDSLKNSSQVIKNESKHKHQNNSSREVQNKSNINSHNEQHRQMHNSKVQTQKHHQQQQHSNQKQQNRQQQDQQGFLYPGGSKTHTREEHNQQRAQQPEQQQQLNDDANEFAELAKRGQPQKEEESGITKNYREYLNIIFDHYCRMSYATGSDPTFEQIQQKTQVMTINKFMIFCKDFGIVKLNGMSRTILVEMFKKNSEFYKEMNYEQFVSVLVKVSYMVYSPDNQEPQAETSKEFQQFLLFLQVNNLSTFKKKAAALSISLKSRNPTQNPAKKIVPINYKFKYQPSNEKTEEQVQEPKQERKRIQSQNKLKLALNRQRNVLSKKNIIKAQHQMRNINDRPQIKSVQPTKKIALAPPIPPARKISTQARPKVETDPSIGVTGYANIHKLKQLGKQGQIDSKLRLNAVVEEAKKIIQKNLNGFEDDSQYVPSNRASTYGRETPNSNYGYGIDSNQGQQNYSRLNQSERHSYSQRNINEFDEIPISKRNYAPHGHSYLQKKPKQTEGNAELDGIIDNDSDHDQFLQQHLNREKKTGHLNQRIQKKIKQIGMRQHY